MQYVKVDDCIFEASQVSFLEIERKSRIDEWSGEHRNIGYQVNAVFANGQHLALDMFPTMHMADRFIQEFCEATTGKPMLSYRSDDGHWHRVGDQRTSS